MGEFGVYEVLISGQGECGFKEALPPVNPYLSILYSVLILLGLGLIYHLINFAHKRHYLAVITSHYIHLKKGLGFNVEVGVSFIHTT